MLDDIDTKKLNMQLITTKLMELATAALTNSVKTENVIVTIELPIQVIEVMKYIAKETEIDLEELYSKMTAINLNNEINRIRESFGMKQPIQDKEETKIPAEDEMQSAMDKMNQLTDMLGQFKKVTESINKVNLEDTDGKKDKE